MNQYSLWPKVAVYYVKCHSNMVWCQGNHSSRMGFPLWHHALASLWYLWSSLMSSISMMPCQRGPCDARENKSLLCPYTEILDMTFARPEASTVTTWTFCERTLEVLSDHSIHPFHAIFFSVWIFSNTMLPHVNEDNLIGHINKQINVCF